MIVSEFNNLRADFIGRNRFGSEFVILKDGEVIHRGCRRWIAFNWKKLTGQNLGTA